MENLYESDFYQWIQQQKEFLSTRQFDRIDLANLIEEVDDMSKKELKSLRSHLTHLLSHCLKWHYQPEKPETGYSWKYTIVEQREQVKQCLSESPSLKRKLPELYLTAYKYAVLEAAKETFLPPETFPVHCPWTYEQILTKNWLPED